MKRNVSWDTRGTCATQARTRCAKTKLAAFVSYSFSRFLSVGFQQLVLLSTTTTMDTILSTITAMRQQENSGYTVNSFLQDDPAVSVPAGPLNVDADSRSKMVNWCYQITDYCKFQRETVEIAINYLDRFVVSPEGSKAKQDPQMYQLAAMTCLYMAVKIHEPQAMDLQTVSRLSRGTYSPDEIKNMESCILFSLQWKLNPPTALSFARQFADLIPDDVLSQDVRQAAYDVTKYQTELAVNECELISVNVSVVAYCALMNSLESVGVDAKVVGQIGYVLSHAIGISCLDDQVVEVQSLLFKAVIGQSTKDLPLTQQPSASSGAVKVSYGSEVSVPCDSAVSPRSIYGTR